MRSKTIVSANKIGQTKDGNNMFRDKYTMQNWLVPFSIQIK